MSDSTYTREQVVALVNRAVDMVTALNMSEPSTDAANLVVNTVHTLMGNPAATLDDVVTENYGDVGSDSDPRTWNKWL
jgi:hypothetical protein